MTRRLLVQASFILLSFLGLWLLLSQVDFVKLWSIEKKGDQLESRLGDFIWKDFTRKYDEITDTSVTAPIMAICQRLCDSNQLDIEDYHIHFLNAPEANAFALPGNHIVLFNGMIQMAENGDRLAGVMAHELGHLTENHLMEKLIREVGLSVLINMTTGGGPETVGQISKLLVGLAYDRSAETEADNSAIRLLQNAGINPEELAHLFYNLGQETGEVPQWLSTHPDPSSRSEAIAMRIKDDTTSYEPLYTEKEWAHIQEGFQNIE